MLSYALVAILAFGADVPSALSAPSNLLSSRQEAPAPDCTWKDSWGDGIACDSFTVIFGIPESSNMIGKRVRVTTKEMTDITSGVDTSGWFKDLSCPEGSTGDAKDTGFETLPKDITKTPWDIGIHGGHMCRDTVNQGEKFDGLWIAYANQFLNIPSDPRCKQGGDLGHAFRCVIPLNP